MGHALIAIVIWSSLAAVSGRALDDVRWPTLLTISLGAGGVTLLGCDVARGRGWRDALGGPPRAWALGIAGIFGYHAFLFGALAVSPGQRVPVNLINYLWPLSLVVFAALLERSWRPRALAGAVVGLVGAGLAVTGGTAADWSLGWGHGLALGAAVTWGGFSALLPRTAGASGRLAGWCLASAGLSGVVAQLTGWGEPLDTDAWLAALYLGVGPLGLAFAAWEAALHRASGQVVGALAYLAPPLSTVLLAWAVDEPLTPTIGVAVVLVVAGAALGASARTRRPPADALTAPADETGSGTA